ncbi:MAG: hypothetical protein ACI3W7_07185, partial [Oscillospiraceae bacterium]
MKRLFTVCLVLAMLCSLGTAFASGEASGSASSVSRDPAPVFQSGVCVLEEGQSEASFVVKGRQLWTDSEYEGIGVYDAADAVTVYDGYDAWQAEEVSAVQAALSAIPGSTDLLLTIPAAGLTENTVYYIAIGEDEASPVYIVTAENAAAVDADNSITFDLGSSAAGDGYTDSFTLPLSSYAMVPDGNNIRLGGAYGLFEASDFADVDAADADVVNWYLTTGGTNGGTALHE